MIVIADTSPLNYLILIDAVNILPSLYGKVYVAPACARELATPEAPEQVRLWYKNRPKWLVITAPHDASDHDWMPAPPCSTKGLLCTFKNSPFF